MNGIEDINNNDMDFEKLFSEANIKFKDEMFLNKDIVGQKIMTRIGASRKHSFRYVWVAASIMVVLSMATYLLSNREVITGKDTLLVTLPDGSQVRMLENSRLSYNRIAWLWKRNIDFKGNARFMVASGRKFTVRVEFGSVEVLGTEFQVEAGTQNLVVECFSGLVGVKTDIGKQIVHPAEKVACSPEGMILTVVKDPLPPFLEFTHTPLVRVISKMEELYGVTITPKDICEDIVYDGLLPTGNLDEALEVVMSGCGMAYTTNGNQITISQLAYE